MTIEEQLRRDEGLRLAAYQDSLGYWTIGVGRLIDARMRGGITTEEADYLLRNDIAKRTVKLHGILPWSSGLGDTRFAVLLNMAFNMGVDGLLAFHKFLGHVESGDYSAAAQEMLSSKWASQVGARALRLSEQMKTGEWK